jgi:hypothetical protein
MSAADMHWLFDIAGQGLGLALGFFVLAWLFGAFDDHRMDL